MIGIPNALDTLDIIDYLRSDMPEWFRNVDAGGSLDYMLDRSRLVLPSFFLRLDDENASNIIYDIPKIDTIQQISIIAILKSTDDKTGKYAQQQSELVKIALIRSLFNYRAKPFSVSAKNFVFQRAWTSFMDPARFVREYIFTRELAYDYEDGAQIDIDIFDKVFIDYNLTHASEESQPNAQDYITDLYNPS